MAAMVRTTTYIHHGGDDRRTAQEGRRCGSGNAGRPHGRHGFLIRRHSGCASWRRPGISLNNYEMQNPGSNAGVFVWFNDSFRKTKSNPL